MNKSDLKIVFLGTSDFGVPTLAQLKDNGYEVVGVVTKPDFYNKRKKRYEATPVKETAINLNIPVLQPTDLKDEKFLSELKALGGNIFIVIAFQMLPKEVFTMPEYGTFNIHASILPDYRGAAPINWAIANGEPRIGLTSFFINEKIDDGDIIAQASIPNYSNRTFTGVYNILSLAVCGGLCNETLRLIIESDGKPKTTKQDPSLCVHKAPKITRENTKIDFSKSINEIFNHIKAFSTKPGAWAVVKSDDKHCGKAIKLLNVDVISFGEQTTSKVGRLTISDGKILLYASNGCLHIKGLQLEGCKAMTAKEFLNGYGDLIENWVLL